MVCRKCNKEMSDTPFCPFCGSKQAQPKGGVKRRGNGQGSVYKENGKWTASRVFGYYLDENGNSKPMRASKRGFTTKKEALLALASLERRNGRKIDEAASFQKIYELWLPQYEPTVSKSTANCYKAAFKYYRPLYPIPFTDVTIEDLQECLDDCPKGKRTRQLMKVTAGLLYKYAIPRRYTDRNLAEYLRVTGEESIERPVFTNAQIKQLKVAAEDGDLVAAMIYCHIYLGYRPHEIVTLTIDMYDKETRSFRHGIKTDAGKDRVVTISPKIQPYIDRFIGTRTEGPVFLTETGQAYADHSYRASFYECLENLEISAPEGKKLTPHCCRHTFATLVKKINAPDKDKLELIGHTSIEMLQHYTHVNTDDLRKITDKI